MRVREILSEKRRRADVNVKQSTLDQLKKYAGQTDVYVSFTDDVGKQSHERSSKYQSTSRNDSGVKASGEYHNTRGSKLGINPRSTYDTPLGIYAYPLAYVLQNEGRVEFAENRPYAYVFRSEGNVLDLKTYKMSDLKADIKKLAQLGMKLSEIEIDKYKKQAHVQTPGGFIWNITRSIAQKEAQAAYNRATEDLVEPEWDDYDDDEDAYYVDYNEWKDQMSELGNEEEVKAKPLKWSNILRSLGYTAASDHGGDGIIHENEPTQAVFFTIKSIKPIEVIHNTYEGSKQKSQFDIWREKPHILLNLMAKGKVDDDTIYEYMKSSPYTFDKIPFDKLPNTVQQRILDTAEQFERGGAVMRLPLTPAKIIEIISEDPWAAGGLRAPLSKAVVKYMLDHIDKFRNVLTTLPKAELIRQLHADPSLIVHLPGSPRSISPEIQNAIVDIDPKLFARYYQSYERDKINPQVLAKWVSSYVAPIGADQLFRTMTDIAERCTKHQFTTCLKAVPKKTALALAKAYSPNTKDTVYRDYYERNQRGQKANDLYKAILTIRPELKAAFEPKLQKAA